MLALSLLTADAKAQPLAQSKPSFWTSGPAGGAYGLFLEGGVTAGSFEGLAGSYPFAAGSFGLGASLRWFEASFTGYYGSTFDSGYSGGGFLGRVAARVPVKYVAFTIGSELGYLKVPGHYIEGLVLEPVSLGVEIDPVCHLRIGVLGAFGWAFAGVGSDVFRSTLTVGYAMGPCPQSR